MKKIICFTNIFFAFLFISNVAVAAKSQNFTSIKAGSHGPCPVEFYIDNQTDDFLQYSAWALDEELEQWRNGGGGLVDPRSVNHICFPTSTGNTLSAVELVINHVVGDNNDWYTSPITVPHGKTVVINPDHTYYIK